MTTDIKRWTVWINLALFSMAIWYCIAELFLSFVWQSIWH